MRPLAPIRRELLITGVGGVVIGLAGQVGAFAAGAGFAAAVLPFLMLAALFGLIQYRTGHRWLLTAAAEAPDAPPEAEVEPGGRTRLRLSLTLLVWAALVVVALIGSPAIASPVGGVIFGIALIDLRGAVEVEKYRGEGAEIMREVGPTWIAGGRRPLYRLSVAALRQARS
ncbi:MAG: hypothetical protein OEM67_03360 [Thermoleophilia bacterium]|nr:hypothetical protein [Thermoleophilia bacterium]